jgi:hypothetical protein
VRHPAQLHALLVLLLRTKREHPQLSASGAGLAVSEYLNDRLLGVIPRNRLCRGVLLLPDSHQQYLRGRRREALRRNLRRAATAGIRCATIDHPTSAIDTLEEVIAHRNSRSPARAITNEGRNYASRFIANPHMTVVAARDRDGIPCAIMAAAIDERVCLIRLAIANSHEGRWALHDHLVAGLIARDVKYLLAEGTGIFGALGYDKDLQRYQHLLGYELRHLVPHTQPTTHQVTGQPRNTLIRRRAGFAPGRHAQPPHSGTLGRRR